MLDIAYTHSGRLAKADYGTRSETLRQTYEYDKKGQLLAVKDSDGNAVESYAYDKAGNMLRKQILRSGRARSPSAPQSADYTTTTFTFDAANQLVSSTTDGVTTRYAYDAAGRLVREGSKTYRYGYLDKVMSVTDNGSTYTYDYHADGQLARANYGSVGSRVPRDRGSAPTSEDFLWDGLALIQRGDEQFINEPHVGGGNPVASSKGTSYFNDMLGTTIGAKKDGKYSAAVLSAFGENLANDSTDSQYFTGKPFVKGLGHAFWMRNYRAGLAKWQSADPMGYPDGWNQLAYCNNGVTSAVDLWGCAIAYDEYEIVRSYHTEEFHRGELCSLPDQRERKQSISGDIVDFLTGKGYGRIDTETVDVGDIWSLCEGEPRINEWDQDGYHYVSERCYQRKTLQKDKLWIWTAEIKSLRAEVDSWVGDAATIGGAVALMAKMLGYATVAGVSVSSLGTATTVTGLLALLDRMLTYSPVTQVELYRQTTFYETDDWRIDVTIFRKRIAE